MPNKLLVSDMCSIVSAEVNTFDDIIIALDDKIKPNCSVLLVADCSIASRFGVLVKPVKCESCSDSFEIEVYIDDHVVTYKPRIDGKDFVQSNNSTEIEVTSLITPLGENVELR